MAAIRIGIVGSGFLAETRARCWAQVRGARVEGVASRERAGAQAFGARHGVPHIFDSAEAMFASDAVDVVDLCIPNRVHRTLTEQAAAAGQHVICTKPLTAYVGQDLGDGATDAEIGARDAIGMFRAASADARAMDEACQSAGVTLFYGENWIYAPGIVRAAGLLETAGAALLEMRGWECHSGSHSSYAKTWRNTGGGALLRLGAHPIGAMLHLKRLEGERLGRSIRPVAVTAETTDLSQVAGATEANTRVATGWQDVENWGCAVIQFSDGSRGVATGSDNVLGGMESRLELYASNCHVKCNLSPSDGVRAYSPDAEVFGDTYLQEKLDTGAGWSTPMLDEDWTSGQLPMCQAFADDIAAGPPPSSDGALGRDVVDVIYAAYVSAREGRRVSLGSLEITT
jgi:predicted dehydrogenase